jgi:hypothetical protein
MFDFVIFCPLSQPPSFKIPCRCAASSLPL